MPLDPQEIYYGVDGRTAGPVDAEKIRELLDNGILSPHDYIWVPEDDEWVAIVDIPHFASAIRAPLSDPPAPHHGWGPELPYAGFWIRLVAHIIDLFVLLLPTMIWMTIAMSITSFDPALLQRFDPFDFRASSTILDDPELAAQILRLELIAWGGAWLIELIYRAAFEASSWQATIGKRLLGLSVCTAEGHRMSFPRAALRHIAKLASAIPFQLGFLMIGLHDRKQGLHDLLARTYVLRS